MVWEVADGWARAIVVGGGKVGEVEEGGRESCHGRPAGSPPRDGRCSEGRLAVEVLCPASNLTKLCDARLNRLPASMLAAGQGVSSSKGNQGSVDGLLGPFQTDKPVAVTSMRRSLCSGAKVLREHQLKRQRI